MADKKKEQTPKPLPLLVQIDGHVSSTSLRPSKSPGKIDPESEAQRLGSGGYFVDPSSLPGNHPRFAVAIQNPFDVEKDTIPIHLLPIRTQHALKSEHGEKLKPDVDWFTAKAHSTNAGLTAAVRNMGHDGLTHTYKNHLDVGGPMVSAHRVWVAFDPQQIRQSGGISELAKKIGGKQ